MANKRTILIVDDDTELREALVEQLALHEEFEPTSADTGTKGVQAARNGQVDLVIMDVGLPDGDGRDLVKAIRRDGFRGPVIMLTGQTSDADVVTGLEAGANVNFVSRDDRGWHIRTYERGVEGETLACGTGSVATAILLKLWGEASDEVELETASGRRLGIRSVRRSDGVWKASLSGEGRLVFEGQLGDL